MSDPVKLIKSRTYELLTSAAVIIFVLSKYQDIGIPYHWDELGVYIPAAFLMKDLHHISLMPGSIDPLFSRGHPLLFTFCNASVFKFFGDTVTVAHIYALFLAVVTLIMFYIFAKSVVNKRVAMISTILLSAQPIFFALSAQILPEMMLTFFTLGCFYGIMNKKWGLYAVFGSLAMLTKESAIVIPATALILLFMDSIKGKDFFTWKRWRLFLLGATPLFVFGGFLIIQKIQNGWFLFPEHLGYIHWSLGPLLRGAWRIFQDLLTSQGRWIVGIPFLAGLLSVLFEKRFHLEIKKKLFFTFLLFIILASIFADVNYYLTRYILYMVPFVILGGTYGIITLLEKIFPKIMLLQWLWIILFCSSGVRLAHNQMFVSPDTCDMSYKFVVKASGEAIHWAEQNWAKDTIEANFPIYQGLEDPRNGYLTGKPINYSVNFMVPRKYGLLFYMWDEANIPLGSSRKFHILKTFDEGYAHVAAVQFDDPSPESSVRK
jgi:hypothetical protein